MALLDFMDKTALYKFLNEEENQGIPRILIEMFKICRCLEVLNDYSGLAEDKFNETAKPATRLKKKSFKKNTN